MKIQQNDSRNYGIDILRMVSMFMAVSLHILGQGRIISNLEALSLKYEVAWLMEAAAYCAVDCFALISGYVGLKSKYRYTNLVVLWIQTVFYTISITAIMCLVNTEVSFNTELCKNMLFPVVTQQYWYFTSYFALFIAIPIYNCALENIEQKQMRRIIIIAIVLFSVVPTVTEREIFDLNNGYSFLWISFLYIIGGYIKKYSVADKMKGKSWIFIYLLCVLLSWGEKYCYELFSFKQTGGVVTRLLLIRYISPTILISAVCLMCCFSKIRVKDHLKKKISVMSASAFAVYLIHAHPLIFELLGGRFRWIAKLPLLHMIIAFFSVTLGIFTVCIGVDMVRNYVFQKLHIKENILKLEEKL